MTCAICNKRITWSYFTLRDHAKTVHHASVKQFYRDCMRALGKGGSVASVNSQDESPDDLDAWARGCQFKCLECGTVFYRYNRLYAHLVKVHSRNVAEYKRAHGIGSTMTDRVNDVQ